MNYLNMVTELGIGSAHPGGYSSTLELLDFISLKPGSTILEVGCGTGRTACLLAQRGYQVTAIDLSPEMIEKALHRKKAQQLDITFKVADMCAIPSEDNQFDVVLAESVTNFANAAQVVAEYYRVLKPGGRLFDCEVIALNPMTPEHIDELITFMGFAQILSAEEWIAVLKAQQFTNVQLFDIKRMDQMMDKHDHYDEYQSVSEGAYTNPLLWQVSLQYVELLSRNHNLLGSAVLTGEKSFDQR